MSVSVSEPHSGPRSSDVLLISELSVSTEALTCMLSAARGIHHNQQLMSPLKRPWVLCSGPPASTGRWIPLHPEPQAVAVASGTNDPPKPPGQPLSSHRYHGTHFTTLLPASPAKLINGVGSFGHVCVCRRFESSGSRGEDSVFVFI